jgi:hypothetical protein
VEEVSQAEEIEEVTAASIFDEVAGVEAEGLAEEDPKTEETSLDELF